MNVSPLSLKPVCGQQASPPKTRPNPPLTPPPIDRDLILVSSIVELIKNLRKGRDWPTSPWVAYSLDVKGYQELLHELKRDEPLWGFVLDKLRLDYFSYASRLVIRMPTALHERFIILIVEEIQNQLRSVRSTSAEFARQIASYGSADIKMSDEEYTTHSPDAQFRHLNAPFPGVVIEVSYSQKRKDLARLADDFILGSDSEIRVVVGLDIEYSNTSKMATLSVWRPSIITNDVGEKELVAQMVVEQQVFRNTDGTLRTTRTGDLRLRLKDFAPEALAGANLRDLIFIPAKKLCSLLEDAEYAVAFVGRPVGISVNNKPWVRKRRRESPPLEVLTSRDEERFLADERRAADQGMRDDSSYKTGSEEEAN